MGREEGREGEEGEKGKEGKIFYKYILLSNPSSRNKETEKALHCILTLVGHFS